ncbi:MAG TPA: hypothetical protein ENJ43_08440 [Gammaproteobacteria bacterium]|nr:hypothetical protein [Gammaproteobacteria bacterium]
MLKILVAVWLLLSIFGIYIFCAAARRFVSNQETQSTPPDNVVVVHNQKADPVSQSQNEALPPAKMRACGD